jgi:microcystin-dependent protein
MADTFTTLLSLRLQQTGGNDNTWGELLNTDVFQALENAIAATTTHATTGGALDLSATPLVHQVHKFTGVLTSNATVTIPNLSKRMLVNNATTGAFVVQLKTASGTAVTIPQGCIVDVYCDGSNNIYRGDIKEVGQIAFYGSATVPDGWLECDGGAISRTNFPELFAYIGTTWGAGNGATTFNLPDIKGNGGRFLRSRTAIVTTGTYQAADIAAHGHSASGTFTGTLASFTPSGSVSVGTPTGSVSTTINAAGSLLFSGAGSPIGSPSAGVSIGAGSITASSTFTGNALSGSFSGNAISYTPAGSISVTVSNSSGTETRPINASALCCIKY